MKVIESKETESKKFFENLVKEYSREDIVDCICIPIYKDGSFDVKHTPMRYSQMAGYLEMAKYTILKGWDE